MSSDSADSNENNKRSPAILYGVDKYEKLVSSTTNYLVLDFIGEGSFGKVAKCVNLLTGKKVAVKILKDNNKRALQHELKMLQAIRSLDPDKNNIVNFIEFFKFVNIPCLAFEMLDRSLWDLMKARRWNPLTLNEIRPVIHQLMVAFDALKSIGIVHTDLKSDNIILVNHEDQPFKIKLIDFGVAIPVSEMEVGMILQPVACRAPEVFLGLPLTEAIDMWGVGCIVAFLYFGRPLFTGDCMYNLMRVIVNLLGQPADHILNAGEYSKILFSVNSDSPRWRLRSPNSFKEITAEEVELTSSCFFDSYKNLEDAVQKYPAKKSDVEYEDRMEFLSLLMSTLDLDPERRVKPRESLQSPFLSMVHLKNNMSTSSYPREALQCMKVLPLNHNDNNNSEPKRPSLHFDEGSSENKPSTPGACGEDLPQVDEKELQVAHIINEEKFTNELQAEKNRNKLLQEELEQLRISHQLLNARYENDVPKIREQADALQHDLDNKTLQMEDLQFNYDEATIALQEEREKNKRLQDQLDNMTVSLQEVIQQVHNLKSDLERKLEQMKFLHTACEELQEAHKLSQEKLSAELHAEKEKSKILKQDLDKIHTSHRETSQRYEADIMMRQQADTTLQHELDKGIMSHLGSVSEGCCVMAEEITILKEKEEIFGRELSELQTQLSVQLSHNLKLSTELKAETEALQKQTTIPNAEPLEPTKEAEEKQREQQETISPAPALESQRGAEGNLSNRRVEPPSVWKRARHFLGL